MLVRLRNDLGRLHGAHDLQEVKLEAKGVGDLGPDAKWRHAEVLNLVLD